jgi:hypothetical protein
MKEKLMFGNTPVVEHGLARTQELFASTSFQKFVEEEKRRGYINIKPGLTEAGIDELVHLCNERFGCSPPPGWLTLLRIMNGYYRIEGYKKPDDNNFINTNTYNLENGYFCDDNGKLKYLMIGWEDESYYGYNLQTGNYAELENVGNCDLEIFHSFADVFLNMVYNYDVDYVEELKR